MGFEIVLDDGSNTRTIDSSDINSLGLPRRHSVINQWRADVGHDLSLEDWTGADAYIYYENPAHNIPRQLVYRGEYERPETPDTGSTTTQHGKDVTRKLDREGAEESYTSIPYAAAVKDYVNKHLPGWTWTVVEPTPEVIDSGETVQDSTAGDAMSSLFSPADDAPFGVDGAGTLNLLQSCFTREGLSRDNDAGIALAEDAAYSGGQAAAIDASGDFLEYQFTPPYRMTKENVGVQIRDESTNTPGVEITLNGDNVDSVPASGGAISLGWSDLTNGKYSGDGYTGPDLEAGTTYTLRLEVTTAGTNDSYIADVLAVYDTRYTYNFDDDNGGSGGYLDGPELFPDVASIVSNPYSSTFNIEAASLTTAIDDVTGGQALQLSNDGGSNYYPQDGSETNTQSVSVDFAAQDSYGTTVRAEVSLGRHGSRTDATPKTGYQGQSLSEFTLSVDTNDLAVIDGPRVFGPGTHYENIQKLHRDGGLVFVPKYKENSLEAETFAPGDVTKTLDVVTKDYTRTKPDDSYANSVTMVGAQDDQGNRLTATAKSQTGITQRGEEIPAYVPQTSVDNQGDLDSLARTELARRLDNDDLTGILEIWPQLVAPGYSYQVPELDDKTLTLESVDFTYGPRGERGRLDFAGLSDLATQLSSIQASVSRQ